MLHTHNSITVSRIKLLFAYTILTVSLFVSSTIVSQVRAYTVDLKYNASVPNYGYDSSISNINGGAWATRLRNAIAEWNGVSSGEGWFFWYRYDNASANRTKALDLRGDSRCTVVPGGCLALTYKYGNPYNRFDVVINVGSGHSLYDGTQSPTLPSTTTRAA